MLRASQWKATLFALCLSSVAVAKEPPERKVRRAVERASGWVLGHTSTDFRRSHLRFAFGTMSLSSFALQRAGVSPQRLEKLHAAYEDVAPGDRYALTYLPGTGTSLSKNGRVIATTPGADFAAAYFSIWLGERPIDDSLRDRLLGFR